MASKQSIRDKVAYGVGRLQGKLGLTRAQAIGVMGSLAGESGIGLNTGAFNPNDPGGSVGIGQWNNGKARKGPAARKNNLYAFADAAAAKAGLAKGSLRKDFKTQMDFVVHELSTYEKGALGKIKSAKTATQAARMHTTYYERPKDPRHQARAQNATYYGKLIGNEKVDIATPDDESVSGANLPEDTRTDEEIDASMASRPGMPVSENTMAEQAARKEQGIQAAIQDKKYDAFANQPQKEGMLSLQQDNRIQSAMESMVVDRPAVEKQVALDEPEVDEDIAIDDSVADDETASAPAKEKDRSIFGRLSDAVNGIGEELGLSEPDEDSTGSTKKSGLLDGEVGLGGILGSLAGGLIGGPMGAVAGGLLGQGLFDGLNGTTDETTGEEDGLLGGLGRTIDGYLNSVGESLGFGSDASGSSNGGLGPDSGKRDGNFGGFASKSSAGTGSRSGSPDGRTGLGDSEQAGNHDSGTGGSGKGGNKGESGKGGKGGKK